MWVELLDGSTMVETDSEGLPIKRYRLKDNVWSLEKDFVDDARPFSEKDKEAFISKLTKTKVVDFFLQGREVDDVPQREFNAHSNYEYSVLKYAHHSGIYYLSDDADDGIGQFRLMIERDANVKKAAAEIKFILKRARKKRPDLESYTFGILEKTLSAHGIYDVTIFNNDSCEVTITSYGHKRQLKSFEDINSMIEYLKQEVYYE